METLYTAEGLGSECYIGTREEWKAGNQDAFKSWYQDYTNQDCFFNPTNNPHCDTPVDYETWIEQTLDEALAEADEEELKYERLAA